ncbi:MAG: hypothetical protein ACXVWW_04480 [Nocardioides sp.]
MDGAVSDVTIEQLSADVAGPVTGASGTGFAGVLVLGMHRTGTSATARVFAHAGFHMGEGSDVIAPDENNPSGYYERLSVVESNDALLARAGATWDEPPSRDALAQMREHSTGEITKAFTALLDEAAGQPLVLKDPRISVLLPLWQPVVATALAPVLVLRNPLECARSLLVRDGIPIAAGLGLWESYLCSILDGCAGQALSVANYDELRSSPDAPSALVSLAQSLLRPELRTAVRPQDAGSAIEPRLHRQHAAVSELDSYLTRRQLDLLDFLYSLPSYTPRLDVPAELRRPSDAATSTVRISAGTRRELQALRSRSPEFERLTALADEAEGVRLDNETEKRFLTQRVEELTLERDMRGTRVNELESEVAQLQGLAERLAAAEQGLAEMRHERDMLERSAVDALDQLRKQAHVLATERRETAQRVEALHRQGQEWQDRIHALDADVRAVRRSTTWRIGRFFLAPLLPLRKMRRRSA